jgi:hypothetical protein
MFCVIFSREDLKRQQSKQQEQTMVSDVFIYALLAGVFVVTGLRMVAGKPNQLREISLARWKKFKRGQ